jgi:hypothetical protein
LSINIDNNISTSTITNINITTPKKLVDQLTSLYTCCVIHATIEAKISKDIQFDIHFSVISSPSRINPIAPTVITKADNKRFGKVGCMTVVHKI